MIRRGGVEAQPHEAAHGQRVRGAPRDAALGVQALEVADQQQAEVSPRRQSWPAHHRRVELLTLLLREPIEAGLLQDRVQSSVERMAGGNRQLSRRNPHRSLFARALAHRHAPHSTVTPSLVTRDFSPIFTTDCYGLSDIKVQFAYDTDYYFALQQTLNRLNTVNNLPNNAQPTISPWSAIGEIYRYQLIGPPGASLMELKTLQDWVLQRRFKTVPGVIDVVGWGGLSKEYHVEVDLQKLQGHGITLPQVMSAISNSNINVGARTLDIGQQAANVRGLGLIRSLEDIANVVLTQSGGTPVLVRDVANVEVGHTPRLGIAGRDQTSDIVEGIVLMRRGEKTMEVIKRIEAEVSRINRGGVLPEGIRIQPYYDRRELIEVTTRTVLHNVVFGIVLVFFIQWMFLGDLRSALIVSATIPFALFFSTMILVIRGDSANLLSVGAIDFGIIVDSTVIMVENIFRHLREGGRAVAAQERVESMMAWRVALPGKLRAILVSAVEVDRAIFFSTAITIAAFIPLFTMQGVEGQIFAPMAKTYGYALFGALLATFTISPVLSSVLLPL